eukprot:CAMPEP_0114260338 /NCGR_PEP_ID=MMETSP0058-20121206/20428_1 /TAXON_ID=36894 /ORGANISM="Pyramimonas parkeae, CCMP726" /LENGTH=219 /DNA_ID=CAMNT_0001375555 /DNA_START=285 /DNA_END=941 /DNA_ORIENTATION=-
MSTYWGKTLAKRSAYHRPRGRYFSHARSDAAAHASTPSIETPFEHLVVRNWQPKDGPAVAELVRCSQRVAQDGSGEMFNPEGPEDDCVDVHEAYGEFGQGDGAMLVVVDPSGEEEEVLGCGAFIAGTEIAYRESGASLSAPTVAALRRVCVHRERLSASNEELPEHVLRFLLRALEGLVVARHPRRARLQALGCSPAPEAADSTLQVPSARLLEEEGFS